jgi:hypothetical protein
MELRHKKALGLRLQWILLIFMSDKYVEVVTLKGQKGDAP